MTTINAGPVSATFVGEPLTKRNERLVRAATGLGAAIGAGLVCWSMISGPSWLQSLMVASVVLQAAKSASAKAVVRS